MQKHISWILLNSVLLLGISISLTVSTILCFGGVSIPFLFSAVFLGVLWSLLIIQYWKTGKPIWFIVAIWGGILSYGLLPTAFRAGSARAIYSLAALFTMASVFFLIINVFKTSIRRIEQKW